MRLGWRRSWTAPLIWALSGASLLPLLWMANERTEGLRAGEVAGVGALWLTFGFCAQALFAGRLIVQWVATEKRRKSVVPVSFWWLSLLGGLMLLVYFWRRGDPVGIAGQLFGNVVYVRNLYFVYRERRLQAEAPVAEKPFDPATVPGPTLSSSRRAVVSMRGANPDQPSAYAQERPTRAAQSRQRQ